MAGLRPISVIEVRLACQSRAFQAPLVLQQTECTVDRRKGNSWIYFVYTLVEFNCVGMIGRLHDNLGDDMAPTCQANAGLFAYLSKIECSGAHHRS